MSILPSKPGAKKLPGDKRPLRERASAVCARVLNGMSLGSACEHEGLDKGSFLRAAREDEEIRIAYAQAKAEGVDASLSDSDDGLAEAAKLAKAKGKAAAAFVSAQSAIARRAEWRAERLLPKVYGNRLDLNHSGAIDLAGRLAKARERTKA